MLKKKYKYLFDILKKMKKEIFKILVLTILISIIDLIIPYLSKLIYDDGISKKNIVVLLLLSCSTAFFYFFRGWVNVICNKVYARSSNYFISNLEEEIFSRVVKIPLDFFEKNESGYIISRIDEVDNLNILFSPVFMNLIVSSVSFIGAIVIIFTFDYRLLLIVCILIPFLYCITKDNAQKINSGVKDFCEMNAIKYGNLQENINAIKDIKAMGIEKKRIDEYKIHIAKTAEKSIDQNVLSAIGNERISIFSGLSEILVLFCIGLLIITGEFTMGDYIAISMYLGRILGPVNQVALFSLTIQPALTSLSRLSFFYDNKTEEELYGSEVLSKVEKIEFKNVSFKYPNTKINILDNCSFAIDSNKKLVIMGNNGIGKSTIFNLLLGFYYQYDGEILINGIELKKYNIESVRKRIGIVPQKIYLFSGTIEENITMGIKNVDASKLEKTIETCGLDALTTRAHKTCFIVSETGKNLSGGQIQKIAIARSLIKDPDILLLDEINNNLDEKSRNNFYELIKNKITDKIFIIITHDKKLCSFADQTIVFKDKEMCNLM